MYLAALILMMFVLPAASVVVEASRAPGAPDLFWLIGKWFTFWAVGVRLFSAGITQSFGPQFTARSIFDVKDAGALAIVREVGFGNLAIGTLGVTSLVRQGWIVPTAVVGGLYFGLAGLGHLFRSNRNFKEQVALVSDLAIFLVLGLFVATQLIVR